MTRRRLVLAGSAAIAVIALAYVWRTADRPAARDRVAAPAAVVAERPPSTNATVAAPAATVAAARTSARTPAAPAPADPGGTASYTVPDGPAPPPLAATAPVAPRGPAYPAGLSADEERALRVRHLVEVRDLVADVDARLARGEDDGGKLRALRDEEAAQLDELEAWAADHGVDAAELARTRAEVDRQRAAAVVEPPRPQ